MNFALVGPATAKAVVGRMVGDPKWDWSSGLHGVDDVLGSGEMFAALDDAGAPIALFVLQKVDYAGGRELVISAALQVGKGGNLVETVLPEIEQMFGGDCESVVICTKRAGLVRKLERAGYEVPATLLRKKLKC